MKNQSVDALSLASAQSHITKRLNTGKLAFAAIIFIAGMLVLIASYRVFDHSSVLSFVLGALAIAFSVFAIRTFKKSTELVYLPTGSVARKKSLFFDLRHFEELKEFVATGRRPGSGELRSEVGGNIRLDVLQSADHSYVALQLYQFVPYMYDPVTEVYSYSGQEAARLSSALPE